MVAVPNYLRTVLGLPSLQAKPRYCRCHDGLGGMYGFRVCILGFYGGRGLCKVTVINHGESCYTCCTYQGV